MNVSSITQHIVKTYPHIHPVAAWGETSFFYNPDKQLPRGVYFATIKEKDGENDRASNLDRADVFRLNIGISKLTYASLFGPQPSRPRAGGVIDSGHDFTALDQLIPHPGPSMVGCRGFAFSTQVLPHSRPSSRSYRRHMIWLLPNSPSELRRHDHDEVVSRPGRLAVIHLDP